MRSDIVRGGWSPAIAAAVLLAASACSPQCGPLGRSTSPSSTPVAAATQAPSPAGTPAAPLQIQAATFHSGEVAAAYPAVALAASGGVQPYTWSIASGELPDGLALGSDGSLSGSPTSAGSFSFTVQVADGRGTTAVVAGTISVAPALSAGLIPACARACQVEAGCVDVCGSFGTLSGGTPPYAYSFNGFIPPSTHPNGLSYAGTFTRPISYWQSTVTVTDAFGETASLSPIFNVYQHISLAGGTCQGGFNPSGNGCSVKLQISGGTPHGTPTARLLGIAPTVSGQGCWPKSPSSTPPAGFGMSVGGGFVTITIPGNIPSGYGAVWTVQLTDQSLCAANSNCVSAPATVQIGVQCS